MPSKLELLPVLLKTKYLPNYDTTDPSGDVRMSTPAENCKQWLGPPRASGIPYTYTKHSLLPRLLDPGHAQCTIR